MLVETAWVVSARGQKATVRAVRGDACHSCSSADACHAVGGGKEMMVEVLNPIRAQAGDRVELVLPEASFLKASLLTYGLPLLFLMGGGLLGNRLGPVFGFSADAGSIILALFGVASAYPLVAVLGRRMTGREEYIPRIIRVLPAVCEPQEARDTHTGS
jgi:sigma-E factor negative regulatory protein RseC